MQGADAPREALGHISCRARGFARCPASASVPARPAAPRPTSVHRPSGAPLCHGPVANLATARGVDEPDPMADLRPVDRVEAPWLGRNRRLSKNQEDLVQTSEALIKSAATKLMLRSARRTAVLFR